MKTSELLQALFEHYRDKDVRPETRGTYVQIGHSKELQGRLTLMYVGKTIHLKFESEEEVGGASPLTIIFTPPNLIGFHNIVSWDLSPEHSRRSLLVRSCTFLHATECEDYQPVRSRTLKEKAADGIELAKDRVLAALTTDKVH